MSSLSVDLTITLDFSKENCIEVIKETVSSMPKCKIESVNAAIGTISVDKKKDITGYGEKIHFSIRSLRSESCNVDISVSPKGIAYLLWRGQCEKVAQSILSALNSAAEKQIAANANSK